MSFYPSTDRNYCGIDLHALSLCLCITDTEIKVRPESFLALIEPFPDDLVSGVECMSNRTIE